MISIAEAWKNICEYSAPLGSEIVQLPFAIGHRLARNLETDVDSPPHDKSLMDGYAVRSADLVKLPATLRVAETVTAGSMPTQVVLPGTATRIMTGAPVPEGADAVVMIELTEASDSTGTVTIRQGNYQPGLHIMRLGQCMRRGDTIFHQGHRVRPHDVGLLAEIGCRDVTVFRRPRIAVLSTGNELVPCGEEPGPGRIRNSNGPMLTAMSANVAASVADLGIARDQLNLLVERMEQAQSSEILLISGGVSEGLVDLVPKALQAVGFEEVFHKVAIKPGKPIWFGVHRSSGRLAFGLPGNPVSSLCCFEVFVRLAIDRLSGANDSERQMRIGVLSEVHSVRGPRPTFWPCEFGLDGEGRTLVKPLVWQGSSDLRCLCDANCFAFFPPSDKPYPANTRVTLLPINF